jgi:uncharacterized protein (AIM24 family)
MMYKSPVVEMNTVFGDGSGQSKGLMGTLFGGAKRLLSGEGLFTTVFTHSGQGGKALVAFAGPFPGTIIPVDLTTFGGTLIAQRDSFLAAAKGVSISLHLQKRIFTGLFGGEGFILQRLDGDGMAFLHVGGTVKEVELGEGEEIHVDTGCVAAFTSDVDFDLERMRGVSSMFFGGEGLFFARLRGPGKVWMQSLPFSRLAGRMLAGVTSQRGEGGSALGPLGSMLQGDNRF